MNVDQKLLQNIEFQQAGSSSNGANDNLEIATPFLLEQIPIITSSFWFCFNSCNLVRRNNCRVIGVDCEKTKLFVYAGSSSSGAFIEYVITTPPCQSMLQFYEVKAEK